MNVNKAIIVGNITADPELKALPSGVSVCNFSMATNEHYKDKEGNKQSSVEFHDIVAFGNLGENIARYMSKGTQIYIEGKIQKDKWEDEESGKTMQRTKIIARMAQFGSSGENAGGNSKNEVKKDYPEDEDITPDDIPF